jgi:hypothetical protein
VYLRAGTLWCTSDQVMWGRRKVSTVKLAGASGARLPPWQSTLDLAAKEGLKCLVHSIYSIVHCNLLRILETSTDFVRGCSTTMSFATHASGKSF